MITLEPIGYVKNQRREIEDDYWGSVVSEIVIDDRFPADCLQGIEEFSHIEIIFYFDKADEKKTVTGSSHPRGNTNWPKAGIFAQRKKDRPNHLGTTIVKLIEKKKRTLKVEGLDAIDGTPVIDIKPVMKGFTPAGEITQPAWARELMKNYFS